MSTTVIVTGGGRGIGAATASLAARAGLAVAVNYAKDEASAERLATAIRAEGGQATAIQADVAVEADVLRLFETAEERLGPIGALVNNAGVTGGFARVDDVDAGLLRRVFAVNITGAFLCAREAVRRLSTKYGGPGGAIVNVSSRAAALGGSGEWVHYAASKGALDTLTTGLAKEVADEGIRVNGVAAGLIDTDLHAAAGAPERVRQLASGIPMGRPGQAAEVAEAIVWLLCSPGASYVTGTTLAVSGGR
ncbi:Rossmann-fold NAD(P)-binding domain-containing protein [Flindersiella endophytica]